MFDARDCMFWWGVQLGMAALELGPLGRYAFSSAGGDTTKAVASGLSQDGNDCAQSQVRRLVTRRF
jgi:hypothetical protein